MSFQSNENFLIWPLSYINYIKHGLSRLLWSVLRHRQLSIKKDPLRAWGSHNQKFFGIPSVGGSSWPQMARPLNRCHFSPKKLNRNFLIWPLSYINCRKRGLSLLLWSALRHHQLSIIKDPLQAWGSHIQEECTWWWCTSGILNKLGQPFKKFSKRSYLKRGTVMKVLYRDVAFEPAVARRQKNILQSFSPSIEQWILVIIVELGNQYLSEVICMATVTAKRCAKGYNSR